jgi:hypothetical protein
LYECTVCIVNRKVNIEKEWRKAAKPLELGRIRKSRKVDTSEIEKAYFVKLDLDLETKKQPSK